MLARNGVEMGSQGSGRVADDRLLIPPTHAHRQPARTSRRLERRIIAIRSTRRWGPHRTGYHLRLTAPWSNGL